MNYSMYGSLSAWDETRELLLHEMLLEGISKEATISFLVAVEELVVNTITYGYVDSKTANENVISIDLRIEKEKTATIVSCTLVDSGRAFNPVAHIARNPSDPSAHLYAGGWGIFLARSKVDEMNYCRSDDVNKLTLRKYIDKE